MNSLQEDNKRGFPITRIETIWNETIDSSRFGYADIHQSELKKYSKFILEEGDILMTHINSPKHLGKCAMYENKPGVLIHGMNLLCLRPNKTLVISSFLKYYFKTPLFKSDIKRISNQSVNQASFSVGSLKKLQMRIPPLPEQKRIAAILDAADAYRQKTKALITKYEELTQSLFLEMFGDPVTNPMGWERIKLNSISKITSGSTPSRKNSENFNGTIPWVKTGEVNGKLIIDTEEKISQYALKTSSCKIYPVGSIIIAMYGQGKTRGKVGLLGIEAATNQACAVIPTSDKINFLFLIEHLKLCYQDLRGLGRGGNQPNLNTGLIKNYSVISPTNSLQNQFAERVQAIEQQKAQAQKSLEQAEMLFGTLLQRAFKGELV